MSSYTSSLRQPIVWHMSAYVSIRQHTSAYVSIRCNCVSERKSMCVCVCVFARARARASLCGLTTECKLKDSYTPSLHTVKKLCCSSVTAVACSVAKQANLDLSLQPVKKALLQLCHSCCMLCCKETRVITTNRQKASASRGIMLKAGRRAEEQGEMREDAQKHGQEAHSTPQSRLRPHTLVA
jgi:hypothetical protein